MTLRAQARWGDSLLDTTVGPPQAKGQDRVEFLYGLRSKSRLDDGEEIVQNFEATVTLVRKASADASRPGDWTVEKVEPQLQELAFEKGLLIQAP